MRDLHPNKPVTLQDCHDFVQLLQLQAHPPREVVVLQTVDDATPAFS